MDNTRRNAYDAAFSHVAYLSDSNSPCWSIWTTCLLRRLLRTSGVGFHNVSCCPDCFSCTNTSLSWIEKKSSGVLTWCKNSKRVKFRRSNLFGQTLRPSLRTEDWEEDWFQSVNHTKHWEQKRKQATALRASVSTKRHQSSHPVSINSRQELLPHKNLPTDLIHRAGSSEERLQRMKRGTHGYITCQPLSAYVTAKQVKTIPWV